MLWIFIHWQFATYYLQTACLFRMTFRSQTEEDFMRVNRRKMWLKLFEYTFDVLLLLLIIYFCIAAHNMSSTWEDIFKVFYVFSITIITFMTLASVNYIHKHSKAIEYLGIKANSTLMKVYGICWLVILLCLIADTIMIILNHALREDDKMVDDAQLFIAITAFFTFTTIINCLLDLLVLYAYHRLNKKLSAKARNLVTEALRRDG